MPQKANVQSPHLEIIVKVKWGFINQVPSKKYFKATEIADDLRKMTGENWTYQRVIETLAQMGYITKLKPNWPWQPTEKAKHYADFSSRILKWSPEVINLILQQQPQQLRLAV